MKLHVCTKIISLSILFVLPSLVGLNSFAADITSKTPNKALNSNVIKRMPAQVAPAQQGQQAVVVTDQAMVYEEANFDSSVLANLSLGQKVRISKKTIGDYYKFYRVKLGNRIAYISAIDVRLDSDLDEKSQDKNQNKKDAKNKNSKKNKNSAKEAKIPDRPYAETRYIGLALGYLLYQESIANLNASDQLLTYGLQLSGPGTLVGPPTVMNLVFHSGAPKYYQDMSLSRSSGFLILLDMQLIFNFFEKKSRSVFLAAGPLLDYSSFSFAATTGMVDSTDLTLGADISLGAGMKIGLNWGLKAEYKFLWDRKPLHLYQITLQNRF